ncbi:10156_t:CDS:2 [Acaulospora colombiana]|uniref:10156_t:CDS:1 n=1 Tax=Acaulospora colombiana TaxID=27376 RepID=A0ACA9NRJ4_9GLOM|nr:10156_t:CDS:2 [Acaulospora colombiana]
MEDGGVAEEGSYSELMQRRGVFYKLATAGEWEEEYQTESLLCAELRVEAILKQLPTGLDDSSLFDNSDEDYRNLIHSKKASS